MDALSRIVGRVMLLRGAAQARPDVQDVSDLHCVEWFSGVQSIVTAFREQGLKACGFDVENNSWTQDFMSDLGFLNALQRVRRLIPRTGFSSFACVCSSWIFLSRGSTGRSALNPMGNTQLPSVMMANMMVSRTVLLILIGVAKCTGWMIEQPRGSLLGQHDRMRMIEAMAKRIEWLGFHTINTYMGCVGADTEKATTLWSGGLS